jgi:hypothetical protein
MKILDWATLIAGVAGLAALVAGAGMIYAPAGYIVGGLSLMGWSYTVARAAARAGSKG